ncbi:hypothetical protein [Litoribrevibacter albus]|uniref:Uncharacterized protein n=1 Tax=Litoribrevibacter albus TaxID=1473156 RepID=A0AA37SDK0_9GAMM|nr:hypothetical protein [Litoribrevibacter albus]GLQ33005.1 hypothetical protein GCM10007876_34840 [Litoribrevibacter albus]
MEKATVNLIIGKISGQSQFFIQTDNYIFWDATGEGSALEPEFLAKYVRDQGKLSKKISARRLPRALSSLHDLTRQNEMILKVRSITGGIMRGSTNKDRREMPELILPLTSEELTEVYNKLCEELGDLYEKRYRGQSTAY